MPSPSSIRGTLENSAASSAMSSRAAKATEWNAVTTPATNCPEAEPLVHPTFRNGWTL